MTYRNGYRRTTRPQAAGPRANRYPAPCAVCALEVPAGQGILAGSRAGGYRVTHRPAAWHGSPVSGQYAGGCPESTARLNLAGQWGPYAGARCADASHASQVEATGGCSTCGREVSPASRAPAQAPEGAGLREVSRRAGSKYAYTSSGARMTARSQRCIDAPCCGCCD